ncbi:MAG: class I SAM-dependent methyltransferase [Candidatus Latescibacterota bacterium]|jgi:SAM-dependent methyltransferase
MKKINMDEIYRSMAPEKIPWIHEKPPKVLTDLVETGSVTPCRTIDFGCGTGNYSIYLAVKGFDVTGVDISPTAIEIAGTNANKSRVHCTFIAADVLGNLEEVYGLFDFAYDYELLHHIYPEDRERYVKNVFRKLNPKGRYLSLCFSEKSPQFGGKGKYRETPLGTRLYFSSENELKDLYSQYFNIEEMKIIEIGALHGSHLAVYSFLRARE